MLVSRSRFKFRYCCLHLLLSPILLLSEDCTNSRDLGLQNVVKRSRTLVELIDTIHSRKLPISEPCTGILKKGFRDMFQGLRGSNGRMDECCDDLASAPSDPLQLGNTQDGASEEMAANPAGANLSRGNNVYAAMWSEPSDSNLLRGNNLYNVIWPAQPNLSRGNNLYNAIRPEPSEGFADPAQPNLSRGNSVNNAIWSKPSQYFNDPAADPSCMTSDYTNGASVAAAQGII
jgi:hypothetical protein